MNCLICNLPEPNYKSDPQVDFICGSCVALGDASAWMTFADKITDGNVKRGLTFRGSDESKVHTYITDFSPKAWRRAYVKALFLEDEVWIKCIEAQDRGRVINSIVECKDKNRTEKNLELQAELRDQIYNNLEYRKGYYETLRDGKPTTKFNKYLHPEVRRYIQKYNRYQNKTEVLHGEDRKLSNRGVFGETVHHEQGTDRDITEPKEPSIRKTLPEEKIILRRRPHTMVARKPDQRPEIKGWVLKYRSTE